MVEPRTSLCVSVALTSFFTFSIKKIKILIVVFLRFKVKAMALIGSQAWFTATLSGEQAALCWFRLGRTSPSSSSQLHL